MRDLTVPVDSELLVPLHNGFSKPEKEVFCDFPFDRFGVAEDRFALVRIGIGFVEGCDFDESVEQAALQEVYDEALVPGRNTSVDDLGEQRVP